VSLTGLVTSHEIDGCYADHQLAQGAVILSPGS